MSCAWQLVDLVARLYATFRAATYSVSLVWFGTNGAWWSVLNSITLIGLLLCVFSRDIALSRNAALRRFCYVFGVSGVISEIAVAVFLWGDSFSDNNRLEILLQSVLTVLCLAWLLFRVTRANSSATID